MEKTGIFRYSKYTEMNVSTLEKRYFVRFYDLTNIVSVLTVCVSGWVAVCSTHCFWFLHWPPDFSSASWISWDTPRCQWPPPAGAGRWPPGAARSPGPGRAGAGWSQEGGWHWSANTPRRINNVDNTSVDMISATHLNSFFCNHYTGYWRSKQFICQLMDFS